MNKWAEFQNESFKIVNLGRPAVFFIPVKKLKGRQGIRIRQDLHLFLITRFGAYSASLVPSFGFWKDASKAMVTDECTVFEVSFDGKEKIPILVKKLAELALEIRENCIYLKAGQYSCLVYPSTEQPERILSK